MFQCDNCDSDYEDVFYCFNCSRSFCYDCATEHKNTRGGYFSGLEDEE